MRKLIVISFLTLDGVMQAPGGKDEDTSGGFKYGGWQVPFWGDEDDDGLPQDIGKAGALLIGRKTYDIFAGYWPTTGKDLQWIGPFMNNTTKYVASKTLKKTEWQNSILLTGDTAEAVAKLKQEPGNDIYMFGSGDLCQTLMRHQLIDEYFLKIYPITLGEGKRLFLPAGPKQDLELLKSKTSKMGVFTATYKVKK
ncbi:dihydrofolate reductase family protein [Bdellovibrio sp. BCCA]|uniref:dihydrofolate reductase family protein n=1 Tax=Bdellovibrio sp. BCCA TaxID=3136281 RepID=UPI0030F07621